MKTLKKSKWIVAAAVIVAIIAITVFVMAGNTVKYLVTVKDSGVSQAKSDEQSLIHRQIVENQSTSSELVFETKVKNNTLQRRDIAILIDTSESMDVNTNGANLYVEARRFMNGLYSVYPQKNTYVSVSNNSAKYALTNNATTALGYINPTNLPKGGDADLNNGLNNAYSTFNTAIESEKFLVVFTDATDEVKPILQKLDKDYGINVVSILVDLNSNQFTNIDDSTVAGIVKSIDSDNMGTADYQDVYKIITKGMENIVLEDKLSQKGINYFDLEIDSANVNDVELLTEGGKVVGYRYSCDKLLSQEEIKIKYKLKIKANINNVMYIGDVYGPDIATNDQLKITYTYNELEKELETKDSPQIQMGKAFSVTLIAVNETSYDIPVDNVEFKIVAKEVESGKIVVDDTFKTSSTGKIIIDDLITTDDIIFDITPNVTKEGYSQTPPTQFVVEFNELSNRREINNLDIKWQEEETRSNLNVFIPINVKKFDFNIELQDLTNSLTKIGKSEFQLAQPKLNNNSEMTVLRGQTNDTTGVLTFKASAMTKDGYYDYILSQLSVNTNFELMGSSRIRVWFKNGDVVNMKVMDNEKVSSNNPAYTANSVNVIVGNLSIAQEDFALNVHLEDDGNEKPIQGGTYRVKTTTHTGQILNYGPFVTDAEGNFTATLYGAGYVKIEIVEEKPNPAYTPDPKVKSVTIYRDYGTIERLATSPVGMSAKEDSGKNALNATIKSTKKQDQNVIRIELVEKTDARVKLKDTIVDLVRIDNNETYSIVTNEKGIAEFALPNEPEGTYEYEIKIQNPPTGYTYDTTAKIEVIFDKNGIINYKNIPTNYEEPILKYEPIDESTSLSTNIGQYIQLGLDFGYTDGCNFTVKLQSSKPVAPIDSSKYDITIVITLENGETIRKEISGAITDANGEIVTPLIKGSYIDIQVTQKESKEGYKIDEKTQDISINNNNGTFELITDSPHNQAEGRGMGTSIYGDNIIYTHKNDIITNEDTYLNLHITKKDEDGGFVSGVGLKISAEENELVRTDNGNPIKEEPLLATTDQNGEVDLLRQIRVLKIPADGTSVTYNFTVVEYDLLSGEEIESSLVKYRIVYRFNPNSSQVELKNLDIIIGKRLEIYSKHSGYLTSYGYESRVELDIYTNYGDVGNFSIDLSKYSNNGEELSGAKYRITVMRPSGCISTYEKEVTDKIELTGFFVSEETTIEIKEIESPAGYKLNEIAEVIRVTGIDEITKAIQIQLESTAYNPQRAVIEQDNDIMLDDGTMKKEVSLKLIDYEEDTFKLGIEAIDSEDIVPIEGYSFRVSTSKGAYQTSDATGKDGKTNLLVGGCYKDEGPVTYTIKQATAATYYKNMKSDIEVQVYFDINGGVDLEKTLQSQTDLNYGKTWSIVAANTPNGNNLDIRILIEPQEKLIVNINTVDELTNQPILGIEYKIPESVNIKAEGTTKLSVGYVVPNGKQSYTIQNTTVSNAKYKYNEIGNQKFQVQYDENGDITGTPTVEGDYIKYVSHNGKEINLEISIEPKVSFTIENKAFEKNTPLQGAEFEITNLSDNGQEKQIDTTDANGFAKICNGRHGKNTDKIYLVKQNKTKAGYAKVEEFYVKLSYNEDKVITKATLSDVNGNEIANEDNIWVNVQVVQPTEQTVGYNGNTQGIVAIEVLSYPALRFNIENTDRRDDTIKLGGTEYSVISNINTGDVTAPTDKTTGKTVAYLDRTSVGGTALYTVRQTKAPYGYQSINPFVVKVYFDSEGHVSTSNLPELVKVDDEGNETPTTSPYITIETIPEADRNSIDDEFVVNIKIQNNPLLKLKINKKDETKTEDLNNVRFNIKGIDKSTNETIVDLNSITGSTSVGELIFEIDHTLENKTIEYTITETNKAIGYKWLEEAIKVEIDYDQDGRIREENGYRVVSGINNIEITEVNSYNFTFNAVITNEEIEEFGIHLIVEDRYDPSKKLENSEGYKVNMRLNNTTQGDIKTVSFIAGRDDDNDGTPDVAHGEDYRTFGQMLDEEGKAVRGGQIYINPENTPNEYYQGANKVKTIYQNIKYPMAINVSFTDEGKISSASLYRPTETSANEQYLTLEYTPGKYTLTIRIHYYPMLQFGINAVDEYTSEHLANAQFEISTTYGNNINQVEYQKQMVKAGWIGRSYYVSGEPYTIQYKTTSKQMADRSGLAPFEDLTNATLLDEDGEVYRRVYIYETTEPNANTIQYQQYEPRHNTGSNSRENRLLAYIDVYYNSKGEIDRYNISAGRSIDNNNTPNGTYYVKESVTKYTDNPHSIQLDIEYKPTTTFKINVIDEVTRKPIGNLKVYPFLNQSSILANRSYEDRVLNYYDVNSTGKTSWTYWGGNSTLADVEYKIGTSFAGNLHDNYELPGTIEVLVTHDQHGRISNAVVKSLNTFGEANAETVGWNETTVEFNILCYRKFNVELYKLDKYDHSIALNTAVIGISSNKGLNKTLQPEKVTELGLVYPNETVRYTISEINAPKGYLPLEIFELDVCFNNDGTIRYTRVNSTDKDLIEQYEQVSVAGYKDTVEETGYKDLVANLYDKQCFTFQLELEDEFYPSIKIPSIQFEITSSRGDTVQGTPITNDKGFFEVFIGESYPGQTVEYTIKQVNIASGYHPNTNIATVAVTFKQDGRIEKYTILNPAPYNYSVDKQDNINQRSLKVKVTNMPKDMNIGITKYDKLTNEKMPGVEFKVIKEYISGDKEESQMVTDTNGVVVGKVDEFQTRSSALTVKYTIKEISQPNTYRKIQDVVIQVKFDTDGRIKNYQVLSNPSKVNIAIALGKQIKLTGGKPVHIALEVPNDNAFDLSIKDEDKNYSGLGIYGTKYDVTIAGTQMPKKTTDTNGLIEYPNRTESGRIEIRIAESPNEIGEGYRQDISNNIRFIVNKGEGEYSLKLDETELTNAGYTFNSSTNDITKDITYEIVVDAENNTIVILTINEDIGTIKVTFKNETKLELTMIKHDIDSLELLKDAKFEIIKEVIEPIPQEPVTITQEGENDVTDVNGQLYFDLGVAPQNQKVKYTFKEITPPMNEATNQPYANIPDTEVTVKFDAYGRIDCKTGITEKSPRASAYMGSMTGLSHSMIVEIANGALNQAFNVKIISEDSQSGSRLNDSKFSLEVKDADTGNSIYQNNNAITTTNPGLKGIVKQVGTYISPAIGKDFKGQMEIIINQTGYVEGYVEGENKTSGKIVIEKENIDTGTSTTADIKIKYISTDFAEADVNVDEENREVTVIIRNDPKLILDITKIYENRKKQIENLTGAVFKITSQTIENGKIVDTDLNIDTIATAEDGKTTISIPIYDKSKKVIYTLKEEKMQFFEELDDIVIQVSYDNNNNIKEYQVLSNPNDVAVGSIRSKFLPITVKNEMTPVDTPYVIQIEKGAAGSAEEGKQSILLSGAKYEIRVIEEFGLDTTWQQYTNSDGLLISRDFNGYGNIRVAITELEAPGGYKLDGTTKHMEFTRDKISGEIKPIDIACDVEHEVSQDNTKVILRPENEPTTLTMYLYNVNKANRFRITDDTSKFEVYLSEDGSVVKIGEGETDKKGSLALKNLMKPSNPGNYDLIIRQVKSPKGYDENKDDMIINVQFLADESGDLYVASKPAENEENVEIIRYGKQYISLNVFNFRDSSVKIEAKKVNSLTNYRIEKNPAKFEVYLADTDSTTLLNTVESDEKGNIDFGELQGPKDEGTCTYIFKEIEAPKGFLEYKGEMKIDVTYRKDANGQKYIEDVVSKSTYIKINRFTSKYINMNISNVPDGLSYTLILEKHTMIDNDFTLIPGGTYRIRVEEEYGETREWEDTTNEDGVIISDVFFGYGYINVYIEELSAPNGFKKDGTEHHIEFYKDKSTGEFSEGSGDVDFSYADTNKSVVYVKPRDEIGSGLYSIVLNKIDKQKRTLIKDNVAEFEIYLEDLQTNIKDLLGTITTSEKGATRLDSLVIPEEAGTYKLILKEIRTPNGYKNPNQDIELEVEFDGSQITKVTPISELVECPKYGKDYMTLSVLNEEQTDGYAIEITKTDSLTGEAIKQTRDIEDNETTNDENAVYTPTEDNKIVEDKRALFEILDEKSNKSYVYTNEEGIALFDKIEKPKTIPQDYEYLEKVYTLREVMAPTGYILNKEPIKIIFKFTLDEEGKVELKTENVIIESNGENVASALLDGNKIKLNISNIQGSLQDGIDRGRYNIILTKIDSITKQIIPSEAELTVALENGQRVLSRTKEEGKIHILDIKAPVKAGEYEYVITENLAPDGYKLNETPQIFKITFEQNPDDSEKLIITNAQVVVNGEETPIIDITSYSDNTVEINVENEKDNEKLYLKSKLDDKGEVIYDVFQKEDVPFTGTTNPKLKTYTINEPFIDTKTIINKRTKEYKGITLEEFIGNLDTNADEIKAYDLDGKKLGPQDIVKTLGKIVATKGTQKLEYRIVVKGDVTGDGELRTNDSVYVKNILLNKGEYNDLQRRAADINSDGSLRTNDSALIKNKLSE